ncbi:MAG: hypothetical protein H0T52_15125 [Lautropia sp.]|nr:hypothetical protein [Lautropia sp.]
MLVLTSDNPRDEAPEAILAQLRVGLSRIPHRVEPDRARAIAGALEAAEPADVVLIAGKGHEQYQEIARARHPFSDVEQADLALQARSTGQAAAGARMPHGTTAGGADV